MTRNKLGTANKKAILYLRVSSEEQTTENQLPELQQLARARNYEIVEVVEEKMSAVKQRAGLDHIMKVAHEGRFNVLVVWALDRLGRSMVGNLQAVLELNRLEVEIVSLREPWLQLDGPVKSLLIALMSWVAEQERARIVERTVVGMERARREGKRIGRPRVEIDPDEAMKLKRKGYSLRKAAKKLGVGHSTLQRFYKSQRVPKG